MAAASLPTELLQLTYDLLDPRDFYSARRVCRWWHQASNDVLILRKQLDNLPIIQPNDSNFRRDLEWCLTMFDKAAYVHMMGMRLERYTDLDIAYSKKINKSKYAVSSNGSRVAALDSGLLTIYDATTEKCEIICEQATNSNKWMSGPGPWFKSAPNASFELALSADNSLVAVALERTIQIYQLSTSTVGPLCKWLSNACGDYVVAVEFAHNDRLLRLQLSKGHVIYLGRPSAPSHPDTFSYWQSAIHQVYLDSAHLQIPAPNAEPHTLLQPHHLRLFPSPSSPSSSSTSSTAAPNNPIPFIIHPENSPAILYYTGVLTPSPSPSPSPASPSFAGTITTPRITGAIPTYACPLLPRRWFAGLADAFPRVYTRETRTRRSPDGRVLAVWDPDFDVLAGGPAGRVHLCRWPGEGEELGEEGDGMRVGRKAEGGGGGGGEVGGLVQGLGQGQGDGEVGKVFCFPRLVGRVEGKIMEFGFVEGGLDERRWKDMEVYRLWVRTDERFVEWDVRLPALVQ
ncbi:hypothetical protein EV356DRAFT_507272 [Viridothelium virens]|uniref:F-box domain-containing protein n=1 Tax=Viridothelium virens TaxID=1048519 RepID=A0A6A6HKZ8_VIRVR|nr:hypothetical protein EV356DRAFT_507272 [Viridothelium virens]